MPSSAHQESSPTFQHDSEIAYASDAIHEASPGHLRATAYLYGLNPPPLEQASVLELGCGAGGHLMPFACAYPTARIVGVDNRPAYIAQASKTAESLGLRNVQWQVCELAEIEVGLGLFDYIIVRNQYSWSTPEAREHILRICRQNLASHGIAYIGYNTYPGWKTNDILRDAMLIHSHSAGDENSRLAQAKVMLQQLSNAVLPSNPLSAALQTGARQLANAPEYKLAQEFLHNENSPCYLLEFAGAAMQAGLTYVDDALLQLAYADDTVPPHEIALSNNGNIGLGYFAMTLDQPKVLRQQYFDFATGRSFRQSLLTHIEQADAILPTPDLKRLDGLRYAGYFIRTENNAADDLECRSYINHLGKDFSSTNPLTWALLETLTLAWPRSMSVDALAEHTQKPEQAPLPDNRNQLLQALEQLLKLGVLRYVLGSGPYDNLTNTSLQLLPCSQAQHMPVQAAPALLFNLWHDALQISTNPAEQFLMNRLQNLDQAQASISALAKTLESEGSTTEQSATDSAHYQKKATQAFLTLYGKLKCNGLLSGPSAAWLTYLTDLLNNPWISPINRLPHLPELVWHAMIASGPSRKPSGHARKFAKKALQASAQEHKQLELLRTQNKKDAAEQLAKELLTRYPADAFVLSALGRLYFDRNQPDEALPPLLRSIALEPLQADAYNHLGLVLHLMRILVMSESVYRLAGKLAPRDYISFFYLGNLYRGSDRLLAGQACYQHALKLAHASPASRIGTTLAQMHGYLGSSLALQGRLAEAAVEYRKSLAENPNDLNIRTSFLFALTHDESVSVSTLFQEHRRYGEIAEARAKHAKRPPFENSREPERLLRIGFVSGDLRNHAVISFLEPIWESLDKSAFHIYAYSNASSEDNVSERLKTHTQMWRSISQLSDQELADQIRADRIDLLFDLSSHTAATRLPMFAFKPAPIQISWLGYPGTTGLKDMDYCFLDKSTAPFGQLAPSFTEKLVHMDNAITFNPPANSPVVNRLPMLSNGYVTFGNFNRIQKISDKTLLLWCQVLHTIPNAKMVIGGMPDTATSNRLKQKFTAAGIDAARLVFRKKAELYQYQEYHNDIDILLDTYPYTGGTTTNHAIWMGVPTLTLQGELPVTHQSSSILNGAGLNDWVCHTQEEFITKAREWAAQPEALAALRQGMRTQLQNQSRWQSSTVTQSLEKALRIMWRRWCQGLGPDHFEIT